jgi:hypothetical protein
MFEERTQRKNTKRVIEELKKYKDSLLCLNEIPVFDIELRAIGVYGPNPKTGVMEYYKEIPRQSLTLNQIPKDEIIYAISASNEPAKKILYKSFGQMYIKEVGELIKAIEKNKSIDTKSLRFIKTLPEGTPIEILNKLRENLKKAEEKGELDFMSINEQPDFL